MPPALTMLLYGAYPSFSFSAEGAVKKSHFAALKSALDLND